jgi:mono/diheme cytochrome c family protein
MNTSAGRCSSGTKADGRRQVMTRRARIANGIAIAALAGFVTAAVHAQDAGQKAFEANKCSNCHAIEKLSIVRKIQSEKMAGPDLSKIGAEHDAAWIAKWLAREVKLDDKTHKNEYKGTKEDLQTISTWLATLK